MTPQARKASATSEERVARSGPGAGLRTTVVPRTVMPRRIGRSSSAGVGRRWLALVLLALLADLSAGAATHSHPVPVALEQGSAPAPGTPAAPTGKVSLDDVCAICGVLAGGLAACTARVALDVDALLASSFVSWPEPDFRAGSAWWDSTASRAPPRILF